MKLLFKVGVLSLLIITLVACSNAADNNSVNIGTENLPSNPDDTGGSTEENPGGTEGENPGAGGTTPPTSLILIPTTDLDVASINLGSISTQGTWSITDAVFDGAEDAKLVSDGTSVTYETISDAVKNAIAIDNTSVTVAYNPVQTGVAIEAQDIVLVATYTASSGYVFENDAETKEVTIIFDIFVPKTLIEIPDTAITDSDIVPNIGLKTEGGWSITENWFDGALDAASLTVDGKTTTYDAILSAVRDAIEIPNTTVVLTYTDASTGIAKKGLKNLSVLFKANAGFVFSDGTTEKGLTYNFPISFTIYELPSDVTVTVDSTKGQTLQAAINSASSGDVIGITGTFEENITLNSAKKVTLKGYAASGATINGKGNSVLTVNNVNAELVIGERVTVTGGRGQGSGINILTGTATLQGGIITSNGDSSDVTDANLIYLGAVYIGSTARFNLESGEITKNKATQGGGVYVASNGIFSMTGGEITGNDASNGGGLFIYEGNGATMSGGEISSNNFNTGKNQVYIGDALNRYAATFTVSESAVLDANQVTKNEHEDTKFTDNR